MSPVLRLIRADSLCRPAPEWRGDAWVTASEGVTHLRYRVVRPAPR